MTPNPSTPGEPAGTNTRQMPRYNCPKCTGSLHREERVLVCVSCRHVPKHGAD